MDKDEEWGSNLGASQRSSQRSKGRVGGKTFYSFSGRVERGSGVGV